MPKFKIIWTAHYETEVEIDDPHDMGLLMNESCNINIPEDEASMYREDSFEVLRIEDENGKTVYNPNT